MFSHSESDSDLTSPKGSATTPADYHHHIIILAIIMLDSKRLILSLNQTPTLELKLPADFPGAQITVPSIIAKLDSYNHTETKSKLSPFIILIDMMHVFTPAE